MASKQDPRRLVIMLVALVLAGVWLAYSRVRSGASGTVVATEGGSVLGAAGSFKVPVLGWQPGAQRELPAGAVGRNIFTLGAPPTPTPDRRPTPTPRPTVPITPAPSPTPPGILLPDGTRLPLPPGFPLTYIGWLGPDRSPVAVFRDGEDVVAAPLGATLKGSFVIKRVGGTSVTVGYIGYPESVTNDIQLVR